MQLLLITWKQRGRDHLKDALIIQDISGDADESA